MDFDKPEDLATYWQTRFDLLADNYETRRDRITQLEAENAKLRKKIELVQADLRAALTYESGHEKERQWIEEAQRNLA